MLKFIAALTAVVAIATVSTPAAARIFGEVLHVVPAPHQPACTVGWKPTGIITSLVNVPTQAHYEFIVNGRQALHGVKAVPAHGVVQIPGFPLAPPSHATTFTAWEMLVVLNDGTHSNRLVVSC